MLTLDDAFPQTVSHGGGGAVIRDHHGSFIAGACHFFPMVADAERAELLACRRAVVLARGAGVSKFVLESDCMGAVAKLKNEDLDRSVHGPLVEEIKELLKAFDDHVIMHVRRSMNEVARTNWRRKAAIIKDVRPGLVLHQVLL